MNTNTLKITNGGGNNISLIHGDALDELAKLPPSSIDCVLTDPPYCSGGQVYQRNKKGDGSQYTQRSKNPDFLYLRK